jgi:hypothetical protein
MYEVFLTEERDKIIADTLNELKIKNDALEIRVSELEKNFAMLGFRICDIEEKLGIDIK